MSRKTSLFASLSALFLSSAIVRVGADSDKFTYEYTCPPSGSSVVLESVVYDPGSPSTKVSLSSTANVGEVCILTLASPEAQQPVARSYNGRDWEVRSGRFAGLVDEPSCDVFGLCAFYLPTDIDTLGRDREYQYVLTSYSHSTSRDAEVARFLQQATFGATKAGIEALSATSSQDGSPDFADWVEHQLDTTESGAGMSSHREFFRSRANPRFEYPFRGGGAGPESPCDISSRWRRFTFTERDGLLSYKSGVSKWLHFGKVGNRFIWYVEGMARTSTPTLPKIKDHIGREVRALNVRGKYRLSFGRGYLTDNMKYSCVGCPVHICDGFGCGFIDNPKIDLVGILGTSQQMYPVIDLPAIMNGDNKMVPMDNGPFMKTLEDFQQPNDEFRLNAPIDKNQCARHPPTFLPLPSRLTGVSAEYHVDSASAPIFGRTFNAETRQHEYMIFDATLKFQENTVENPLPDGGGRLYHETDGDIFCANVKRTFQNEDHCKLSVDPLACGFNDDRQVVVGPGTVVCGSPGEVASNPSFGVIDGFDVKTIQSAFVNKEIYTDNTFTAQRYTIWYRFALTATDQLRQRMAWALYQIVPIQAPEGHLPYTEEWLVYYDVFVRNALGNYRNVLKEVSFVDLMGDWLSFRGNAAIQYQLDNDNGFHFPDENYAREIMQLFSIGTVQLNMDGTHKLDENGNEILTYDSSDIMNYARAWTGFQQWGWRGNHEASYRVFASQRLDPMVILRDLRDIFPKSDLSGGFIGDGYPLCADLPDKDFLRKGATYRLLGSRSSPELQKDLEEWETSGVRLALDKSSPLYTKLCAPDNKGSCTFPGKVILDENLLYDKDAQAGAEFQVDTIRSVRIQSLPYPIYYEYVRPPCVHQNFFNNAKKILAGQIRNYVVYDSMCADPRAYVAAESCCLPGWEDSSKRILTQGVRNCVYNGERMKYSSAVDRCAENQQEQCHPRSWASDVCMDAVTYAWSSFSCKLRVKIAFNKQHKIARVDYPEPDWAGERNVKNFVSDKTVNFFKVPWIGNTDKIPKDSQGCNTLSGCYSVSDGCVCETNVVDAQFFSGSDEILSKDSIEEKLKIGAFPPDMYDSGYADLGNCGITGVKVYSKNNGGCSAFDSETVFFITDNYGVDRYLRNMISTVEIEGIAGLSFRNPVHFIDFADRSLRDMYQETDAVIDSYFYHPSHAPFLAIRIIQRFGISNPSPQFIKRVATAYKTGSYIGRFGSGKYGDLGAMIAAVLLDPEARSVSLDADPSHGHVREPTLKLTSFLRSMDTEYHAPLSIPFLNPDLDKKIGQAPYKSPSVFSFFLPEFSPSGAVGDAGLVSPESMILDNRILTLLDGFFSTVKFGISRCAGGFGYKPYGGRCPQVEGEVTNEALGELGFTMESSATMDDILDELSLLLTSSRLGQNNRAIIKQVAEEAYSSGDKEKAIRIAQQLIATTPEFHTTNLAQNTGTPRQVSGYTVEPSHKYKAVIYFFMEGGADTFNLLVPKGGCAGKDMFQEYRKARQGVALDATQLLDIDATDSNQICKTFGVNNNFPLVQKLYSEKQAIFFANTGVLTKPMTKTDNWIAESRIQLFAHNHMIQENYRADPLKKIAGTGVGGRMMDILRNQGYHTSSNAVDGAHTFAKGHSKNANPTWNVATFPVKGWDVTSSVGENMLDIIKELNGEGDTGNSLYGETWSSKVAQVISEYETGLSVQELIESGEIDLSKYPRGGGLINERLRAIAQFMKLRHRRRVDRDVFVVQHNGFDHHNGNVVNPMFEMANDALHNLIDELRREDLWEDTVIIMGSDFGRSITTNSNGGTDHAWGGNYFMIGGSVKGGKILGEYPHDLSEKSSQWIMRGRMIPTTGWDSIWNGIGQWMGVRGDNDLDYLVPNRGNFDKCSLYTDSDLFVDGQVPHSSCKIDDSDGDGVPDSQDECPNTKYIDFDKVNDNGCVTGETGAPVPLPTQSPTVPPPVAPPIESPTISPAPVSSPTGSPTITPTEPVTPPPTKSPTPAPTTLAPTPEPFTSAPTLTPITGKTPVNTVLSPGTTVVRVGGAHNKDPTWAIDGNTRKFLVVKDGTMAPGAEFTPTRPLSVVKGIRIYTGDDAASRDPASYVLEGRKNGESEWQLISSGPLELPLNRNRQGKAISSTASSPDTSKHHQEVSFRNNIGYAYYRLTFPETRSTVSGIVQIAEVELPGFFMPVEKTPTVAPTHIPTKTITQSPTSSPVIISPTDAVANVIDSGSPSYLVGTKYTMWDAAKAFDGTTDKAGIPRDETRDEKPGFVATPSRPSVVKGIRVYSANNLHSRDPASYVLMGRNHQGEAWHLISQGDLSLPMNRNILGVVIQSTFESGGAGFHYGEELFHNHIAFSEYKVNFPTTRGDDIGPVFAEVELPGYLVTDKPPTTSVPTKVPTTKAPISVPPTAGPTLAPVSAPTKTFAPSVPPTAEPTLAPVSAPTPITPVNTVLSPGTTVVRVGGTHSKAPKLAIDGNTRKFLVKKDGTMAPGAEFTPPEPSVVTGMRIYTANDSAARDPASYVLEGRKNGESEWQVISSGPLKLPRNRNPQGKAISSTASSPDMSKHHQEVLFENGVGYSHYRLTFPTTRKISSNTMQIAEVELPGYFAPEGQTPTVAPTHSPTKSPEQPPTPTTDVPTFTPTKSNPQTNSPTSSPVLTPVTKVNTVLSPGTTVVRVGGAHNKDPTWAIDGNTRKFLVFKDGTMAPGAEFTPPKPSVVTGIRIYTGDDGIVRDPASYVLEGRSSEESEWQVISSGPLDLPRERNPQGNAISSTASSPDMSKHHQEVTFANNVEYSYYRLTFPTTRDSKNGVSTIVQIAEVELPGQLLL